MTNLAKSGDRVRVEQIVGQRIRDRRESQGITQETLGQRLGVLLGREWPRQAVSAAERGNRAFTAAELTAFAHILGTSIGRMFTPPLDSEGVELPGGIALSREEMVDAALPQLSISGIVEELRVHVAGVRKSIDLIGDGAGIASKQLGGMDRVLDGMSEIAKLPEAARDAAHDPEPAR